MHNRIRLYVRQISIIAVLISTLSSGCTHELTRFVIDSGYRPPYVPELDNYIINLEGIQRTSSQEDVRAILGEPPFVHEIYGDRDLQWTRWWYPIRSIGAAPLPAGAKAQRQVIPAAELRVRLDASGRVEAWGFYHPISNSPIWIRESMEQTSSRLAKACNRPKWIELGKALKTGHPKRGGAGWDALVWGIIGFNGIREKPSACLARRAEGDAHLLYRSPEPSLCSAFLCGGDLLCQGKSWHALAL